MLRIYSTNPQLNPRPLEEDAPPHLAGCAAIRRARFVTRLRIVQAEMAPNAQGKNEEGTKGIFKFALDG
jgi:hypothetical protein